jgi:hypothetical protein
MVSFTSFIVAAAAFAGVLAMPTGEHSNTTALLSRAGTASSTGTNNGYYYQVRVVVESSHTLADIVCSSSGPTTRATSSIPTWPVGSTRFSGRARVTSPPARVGPPALRGKLSSH